MKRILWLAALLVSAVLGREMFGASDVARLQPVEVLRVEMEGSGIRVETDTGEAGRGSDLSEAFGDLKAGTAGDIFLDTVEFVLLAPGAEPLTGELMDHLRPACQVCLEDGRADLSKAAAFLDIHRPQLTLMHCRETVQLYPVLVTKEGEMKLVVQRNGG